MTQTPLNELKKISDTELEKALAANDFGFFVEYVHHGQYYHTAHTEMICDALTHLEDGEIDRLMVLLPPRHSKSMTITESFPSYFIGRDPDRRVILTAYGDGLARGFGRSNLQKIREYGGELFDVELSERSQSAKSMELEGYRGGVIASGIGGAITGRGADLLVVDDPVKNWKEAQSTRYREMVWDEWQNTLLTRLHPGGRIVVVMTRWHHDDLAGRLMEEDAKSTGGRWTVIRLPALAEENDPLDRDVGDPLWPEHGFDGDALQRIREDVGAYTWNALYQQRPTEVEGGILKRGWMQYYDDLPEEFDEVIQSWDCAFKDSKASSYVVGQVWGRKGPDKYLIHQERAQMGFVETQKAVRQLTVDFPETKAILIEDAANGPAVIETLRRHISSIIPVQARGSKEARAHAVSPEFEAGNVYLPNPRRNEWVQDYIQELIEFPNGAHDDQVDATTQALMRFRGGKKFTAIEGVYERR